MSTCTLTGTALRDRARALNIPRRSTMTADELRSAITAAESATPAAEVVMVDLTPAIPTPRPATLTPGCPITGSPDCESRNCELHYMSAPVSLASTPFRAPRGKRKMSRTRIHRRAR